MCAAPLLSACRSERPLIRIGLVIPLSGRDASVGENILAAARYAIAEANEESLGQGLRFVLAPEDEATLPESLVTQARKLAADRQNIGVVGYLSQGAVAAPIFAAADLPFLVLGTGPLPPPTPTGGGLRLHLAPSETAFVEATTRLVTDTLRARRVAIARIAPPDSGNLLVRIAESLTTAGLVVEPPAGPAALPLAPPPDIVLVAGPALAAAEALLAIRSRGYAGRFICVDGCDTPDFLKVAGEQAARAMYLAVAPAPQHQALSAQSPPEPQSAPALPAHARPNGAALGGEVADPAQRLSRSAREAWPMAALAYDGVHILVTAARQSGARPTRQAVALALLASPTPVPGASGPLAWDQSGQRQGGWPAVYEYAELRHPARLMRWPPGTPGS